MSYFNQTIPGSYTRSLPQGVTPTIVGVTDLVAIVGSATDGPVGVPISAASSGSATALLGADTTLPLSALREYLSYIPEGANAVFCRVTDGTETAATMQTLDGSSQPGVVGSFVSKNPGTNANAGTHRVDLRSGSPAAAPVYRVTVTYPNRATEVFDNIIGFATPGGAYSAVTYQANLAAAVNGTAKNVLASANWVYSPGSSTIAPATGQVFTAAGGTNGTNGLGSQQILGVDGSAGSRRGVYALAGTGFDFLLLAADTDPTIVQTVLTFVYAQGTGMLLATFPQGTSPTQAIAIQQANNLKDQRLIPCLFWDYVYDGFQAQAIWVSPMGKIAGILASLDPDEDPLNKPEGTNTVGIISTEATAGQGLSVGDETALYSNGIMYLTLRPNGLYGLAHGNASDGSSIADTRMGDLVAKSMQAFMYQFVGKSQTVPLLDTSDASPDLDATRTAVRNGGKSILNQLTAQGQLTAGTVVCDKTNNIRSSVLAKKLFATVYGTTKAGISFIFTTVQVGSSVSIIAGDATTANAS